MNLCDSQQSSATFQKQGERTIYPASELLADDDSDSKLHFFYRRVQSNDTEISLKKYALSAEGIEASFISYGARLTHLVVNDRYGEPQDVVLGYDYGSQYIEDTNGPHTNYGAVVGRYANRIKNGTFSINGSSYHIPENENKGKNTLHGGLIGYDQRNWTVVSFNDSSITFSFTDYGYQGFPGNIISYATYSVSNDDKCKGPRLTCRLISIPLDKQNTNYVVQIIYTGT